jgi:hypothetical protein
VGGAVEHAELARGVEGGEAFATFIDPRQQWLSR